MTPRAHAAPVEDQPSADARPRRKGRRWVKVMAPAPQTASTERTRPTSRPLEPVRAQEPREILRVDGLDRGCGGEGVLLSGHRPTHGDGASFYVAQLPNKRNGRSLDRERNARLRLRGSRLADRSSRFTPSTEDPWSLSTASHFRGLLTLSQEYVRRRQAQGSSVRAETRRRRARAK